MTDGYGRELGDVQPDQWGPLGFEILDADGALVTDFRPIVKRPLNQAAGTSPIMNPGTQYLITDGFAPADHFRITFECPKSQEYRFLAKTIVLKSIEFIGSPRLDLYWIISPGDVHGFTIGGAIEMRESGAAENNNWNSLDNEWFFELEKGTIYTASPIFQPITGSWHYWQGATYLQVSVSAG